MEANYTCIENYLMDNGDVAFIKGKDYYFDKDMQTHSELFPHDMSNEKDFNLHFKFIPPLSQPTTAEGESKARSEFKNQMYKAFQHGREDCAEKVKLNHYEYRVIDGIGMFRETKYKEKQWSINDGAYVQIDKSSITDRPLPDFKTINKLNTHGTL